MSRTEQEKIDLINHIKQKYFSELQKIHKKHKNTFEFSLKN